MSVWYFYYPKRLAFDALDYWERGLAGTEGSIVLLAEALARAGHDVTVFNACYRPGVYNGVKWQMAWQIDSSSAPDVLVSVKYLDSMLPHFDAKKRIYWMMDHLSRGAADFITTFGPLGGKIVIASMSQRYLLEKRGIAASDQIVKIPLPVETNQFQPAMERQLACIYCSIPHRGLDVVLKIWPTIQREVPDAELWVTSGYQLWGLTDEESASRMEEFLDNYHVKGVKLLGVIPKAELIRLQSSCMFMIYPCRIPEMFCVSAAECSAAGTPIIASALGALRERVVDGQTGYLINGDIESPHTQERFAQKAAELFRDHQIHQVMSNASIELAASYAADQVAREWEKLI